MTDQTDAVTIKFRLTSSDVFWVLVWRTIRRSWFLLLLPIFGSISIVWAAVEPNNGAVTVWQAGWMLLVGAFLFVGLPYLQTRATMKAPNFGGLMALTVSPQGIESVGEHSKGSMDWSMVKGVSEMAHAILIDLKPAGIQIVPKRQLTQEDVAEFRKLLRLHAPGKVRLAAA